MKNRISSYAVILIAVALFIGMACSSASAIGKSWSAQEFSDTDNIVIVGNESKFATVYAISLPEKKILWKISMPQSQKADIIRDNDVVYIVGPRDMGIFDKTIKAHKVASTELVWARKMKGYTRVSPVFDMKDHLIFAIEMAFRGSTEVKLVAINKKDGQNAWEQPVGYGHLKDITKLSTGDFLLVLDADPADLKSDKRNIKVARVNAADGKLAWTSVNTGMKNAEGIVTFEGTVSSDLKMVGDDAYFLGLDATIDTKNYTLYGIDNTNGTVKMKVPFAFPITSRVMGEPLVSGNHIVILTSEGKMTAYNTVENPGSIAWEYSLNAPVNPDQFPRMAELPLASPILEKESGRIFVVSNKLELTKLPDGKINEEVKGSSITAVTATDGKRLWLHETQNLLNSSLVFTGTDVLVGARVKNETPATTDAAAAPSEPKFEILALDSATGTQKWSFVEAGAQENTIEVNKDTVFFTLQQKQAKGSHVLIAVNAQDGKARWTYRTDFVINSGLTFTDEAVQFGTQDGYVVSVNLADGMDKFKFFAGNGNEIDTTLADAKDSAGKVTLLGFATQDGKYFIIDSNGVKQKTWNLKPLFALYKLPILLGSLLLGGAVSWFIFQSRRGKEMFIRRIAGLNAIDEAVGRSTEMGKPVVYVTGLADVDDIQTLASLSIMGHIAQKTAEYDTPILVPCCRSVVMSTAQEVVKESYLKAGRPDTFRRENIYYLTDDQFGYVAGVDGIMVREKPAANFYLGKFFAESLILAETGHSTGAIQIAGTAEASQLPFFVAACDYTLIGEELFAASAYLSKDPMQIGSLKGQDVAKAMILIGILVGCVVLTAGYDWVKLLFATQ